MLTAEILTYILSFIFGSIIGSFLNVCIHRLPRSESIVYPSSHCPSCNKPIHFYNNIPILSYLILGGKCPDCRSKISVIYPVVEILTGLIFLATVWSFGLSIQTLFYLVLFSGLIAITFIDLEHLIIPNVITYPGIMVGLLFGALRTDWDKSAEVLGNFSFGIQSFLELLREVPFLDSIFGIVIGGGVLLLIAYTYEIIKKRQGMGIGDVKLLAMIGAFFGWEGVLFVLFLGAILGSVIGIAIIISQKGDMQKAIPFGPFLSIAAVVYAFTGGFKIFI